MSMFSFFSPQLLSKAVAVVKSVVKTKAVGPPPNPRNIKRIVVHCTGGPPLQPIDEIERYWLRAHPTWKGRPGYHIIVSYNGGRKRLQQDHLHTNGVAGYNSNSLHVCYTGGQEGHDTRSEAQKAELLLIIMRWLEMYPTITSIVGHRDLSPDRNGDGEITADEWIKTCPGFNATKEYAHLL